MKFVLPVGALTVQSAVSSPGAPYFARLIVPLLVVRDHGFALCSPDCTLQTTTLCDAWVGFQRETGEPDVAKLISVCTT